MAQGKDVNSVLRAFTVLECLMERGGEAGISELSTALNLPVPTLHRLIRTLVTGGYVRQLPSRRYALGSRLVPLGEMAARQFGVLARPVLARLAAASGETSNLAILEGNMVVYQAQVPSKHAMRMFTEVGRQVQPHCTGVGKALLAQLSEQQVRAIAEREGLPAHTARTITDVDALLVELKAIRLQGYAEDDGEQEIGVRCFAVAIPDAPTAIAISVSGPATRVTKESAGTLVPLLQEAAAQLSAALA